MPDELFDLERAFDRSDLAALFDEFATAFESDRPASIATDGTRLEIDPPPRATVEVELEREGDDEGLSTVELELELEWDDPADGPSSVRVVDDVDPKAAEAAADDAQATLESAAKADDGEGDEGEIDDDEGKGEDGDASDLVVGSAAAESNDGAAEEGGSGGRRSRFEVYEDRGGEWRWRLVHWNGNVVADGGEGYASRHNAERALRAVMRTAPDATVERVD